MARKIKVNEKKVLIFGVNKDVAKMAELKAEYAGKGNHVIEQNSQFYDGTSEYNEDAGTIVIIGNKNRPESKAIVEDFEELPGKRTVKFIDSPALEAANKKRKARQGGKPASSMPNESWSVDKIKAYLTLNDKEFKASDTKDELLSLV